MEFLQRLGDDVGSWLYLILGLITYGETAVMLGVVLPGEVSLLVGGFAAREGWVSLGPMMLLGMAAAVLGDSTGYLLGRIGGPSVRSSRPGRWIGVERWERSDVFVNRLGGKAVFVGRFGPFLRTVIPVLAGMARLPYTRVFLPWNIAVGALWGGGNVLIGYAFSASLAEIERGLAYGSLPVLGVILAVVAGWELRRRRQAARTSQQPRQPHRMAAPADPDDRYT